MQKKDGSRAAADSAQNAGFLTRLRRDVRGNTLAIVGAALVPLAAMIGSGVDMSRAYMAKIRLQGACDASALAGRRIMENGVLTTDANDPVRREALRYFNFNFRQRQYDTEPFTPVVTAPTAGTVRVTASTRIPTSIMHMFGFESLPLNVSCDASLNFVNTDVMLVLDVTGSMLEDVNGNATNTDSARKITALRDAVMALYTELRPTQLQLEAAHLRLRYGIVPYSSAVNVGKLLRADDQNNLAALAPYSTRIARYNTTQSTATPSTYWEYYRGNVTPNTSLNPADATTGISQANCLKFMQNQSFSGFVPTSPLSGGGPAPTPTWTVSFPHDGAATAYTSSPNNNASSEWAWTGAPVNNSGSKSCRRKRTDTTTTYRYTYTDDRFLTTPVDVSGFRTLDTVTMATGAMNNNTSDFTGNVPISGDYPMAQLAAQGTGVGTTQVNWAGCIEERTTVSSINTSTNLTIPSGADDLNINLIPTSDATRWRPHLPQLVHRRSGTSGQNSGERPISVEEDEAYWACPTEAKRLQAFSPEQMQTYVNSLRAIGGTYHDIGMIWGARMLSTGGVFADGCDTFNSMPCTRHIIFMTDGNMAPNCDTYTSYGVEQNDIRVTGAGNCPQQQARHNQRFRMICNAAKGMNISIWVIAFGVNLNDDLRACATNSNQASTIGSRDALIARFRQIGNNIGALRLTQ